MQGNSIFTLISNNKLLASWEKDANCQKCVTLVRKAKKKRHYSLLVCHDFDAINNKSYHFYFMLSWLKLALLLCLTCLISAQLQDVPKLPLYVGRSYNLLEGNPLSDRVDPGFEHSIFQFTYNNG